MKAVSVFSVSCLMSLAFLTSTVSAQTTVPSSKFEHEKRMKTAGGTLAIREGKGKDSSLFDILLKDKVIASVEGGLMGPSFLYKFSRKGSDVVLFSSAEGQMCESTYFLLAITPDGKTSFSGKDGFGNCQEMASLTYDDNKVSVSIPANTQGRPSKGKQSDVWHWDYGNSAPVKQK